MEERIYNGKKNGLSMLLLTILLYILGIASLIFGAVLLEGGVGYGAAFLAIGII